MRILNRLLFSVFFSCLILATQAQTNPAFLNYLHDPWVDSTLNQMSLDERIGQLFIAQIYSNKELQDDDPVFKKITQDHIGGIIFMQGTAESQAAITNRLQKKSKVPLLISMDAEWGPGFRLKGAPKYPVQMALGAIQNDSLIYRMGYEIGTELKRIGVDINYAPVADVNCNPDNPVINYRSFGEDPHNVAHKCWLYAHGMQDAGVLAVAKHYPGHGDTRIDSHLGLPVIKHDFERLDSVEFVPFDYLIKKGIGGIMTGHLQVEAFDPNSNIPASLSKNLVQNKLIDDMGFNGMVITDAMNMNGVSKQFGDKKATVMALQAGNDLLETVPNLEVRIAAVKEALKRGRLSEKQINQKCRKVLALKKWLHLDNYKPIETEHLDQDLKNPEYLLTRRLLHEESLTLLKNDGQLLPLQKLDTLKIAVLSIGTGKETYFQKMLANYIQVDFFNLKKDAGQAEVEKMANELRPYNLVICGIHDMKLSISGHYGLTPVINEMLSALAQKPQIVVLFGNPYALNYLKNAGNAQGLLVTYQENRITQELAAQAIFGGINVNGKLPVNVNDEFKLNDGLSIKKNGRFKFTIPEEVGMSSSYLEHNIDSIAELGLREKAYPGCQILVAKDGKIVFQKCYGYFTYDKKEHVQKDDIYDWASITKITGPLPALIKLYDENKFKLDVPFSVYWPDFRHTNKDKMTVREVLAHQAGLKPWIPFYENTLKKNGHLKGSVFKDHPTSTYDLRVSSHLYMNYHYKKKMYDEIRDSELLPKKKYTYSGLAFYLFPQIIENLTGEDYQTYLYENFYAPLGASSVTYNAYKHFPKGEIIPTEKDNIFRKELLQGFVHDEGASMMGGVSGNAGLFGTAIDLAKIMQMYLQYGRYGGVQYLDSTSMREFTRRQYPENENRRGLGFDKPYIDNDKKELKDAYPAVDASTESFGHSGYTGTFTWVDPKNGVLFVFFSNHVYPTRNNSKIFDLNIRPAMHQAIYNSLKHYH